MRVGRVLGPVAVVATLLVTAVTVLGLSNQDHARNAGTTVTTAASTASSVFRLPSGHPNTTPAPSTRSPAPATHPSVSRATAAAPTPHPPTRAVTTSPPAPSGRAALPVAGAVGDSTQAVTVTAPSTASTRATVQAWTRTGGRWFAVGPAVPAWLGDAGLTSDAREGYDGTPIGSFGLTHAFGNDPDPGTSLPYFQADADDWWSGDSSSPTYNTHQHCAPADCSFDTSQSENLHDVGWAYSYAVVIDYNMPAVPGKGSAFFLHVTQNEPTQGCVSIPQDQLVRIMRWLDPRRHPRIVIGLS